jgi:hypothetical protein
MDELTHEKTSQGLLTIVASAFATMTSGLFDHIRMGSDNKSIFESAHPVQ